MFAHRDGRCILFVHKTWSHSWSKHMLKEHIKPFWTKTQRHLGTPCKDCRLCLKGGIVCNIPSAIFGDQWHTHRIIWLHKQGGTCCHSPLTLSKRGFLVLYNPFIPDTIAVVCPLFMPLSAFRITAPYLPLATLKWLDLIMQIFAVRKYTCKWLTGLSFCDNLLWFARLTLS